MRKLINSTYVSLDGVVERPHMWPPTDDDGGASEPVQTALLSSCDAILMGRRTYEAFAPVWPTRSDAYADRINTLPKYVVSSSLSAPEWHNCAVLSGDVPARVAALKQQAGQDIVQYGFGEVSALLMDHGLIDELRLWVHPLVVGRAQVAEALVRPRRGAGFALRDATPLPNGIVILAYAITG